MQSDPYKPYLTITRQYNMCRGSFSDSSLQIYTAPAAPAAGSCKGVGDPFCRWKSFFIDLESFIWVNGGGGNLEVFANSLHSEQDGLYS